VSKKKAKPKNWRWRASLGVSFPMQNDSKFFLHFQVQGDGTEWIDANLPTPNYFYRMNTYNGLDLNGYCIAYLIDGVFGTEKGRRYLNDIIARFILTLPIKQRLMYPPPADALHHEQTYKLKQFQNLKSKAKEIKREIGINADWGDDQTFIELKLWIEYQIKNNGGEGSYVEFDLLLDYAWSFYEFKDYSTARSKCRNIWNWYEQRNFKYHLLKRKKINKVKRVKVMATRKEQMQKVNENRKIRTKNKIISILNDVFLTDKIKKKNGKFNIKAISELTELDQRTVSKHLKELGKI